MRVQAAPAEYRREGCVRPQPPDEPDQIPPDGYGNAEEHRHIERRPRHCQALHRIEQDDSGRNGDKGGETDQSKSHEPSDGRGARRGQALPRHPLFFDLERRCLQLLHALKYTPIPPLENGLVITPIGELRLVALTRRSAATRHRCDANLTIVHYNIAMGMKVYRAGRQSPDGKRRGRVLRPLLLILFVILALALVYLILPFGGQRVVLLGSDARAGEASRSDTIVVTKAGGGMLAVPRDTLVDIPGVGEDDYVIVHFGGVEEIVDALGGITLEVDKPIKVGIDGRRVYIPAGTHTLNGMQALAYVRYRGGPTADIGRIGRQQKFLRELAHESTSPAKLPHLPATARATWRNIDTNMNPLEAARFAVRTRLSGIENAELYPGTPQYIGGISYWVPDKEAGDKVVSETIE